MTKVADRWLSQIHAMTIKVLEDPEGEAAFQEWKRNFKSAIKKAKKCQTVDEQQEDYTRRKSNDDDENKSG